MHVFTSAIACILVAIVSCSVLSASEAEEARTIRQIDAAWSQALQDKDLDKVMSNYAQTASFLPPDEPLIRGTEQIRRWFERRMGVPGYSASFIPTTIVVSKSGDMAYELGTFRVVIDDASGKPVVSSGKHLVAWQKHGRVWKVVAESINRDAPSTQKP